MRHQNYFYIPKLLLFFFYSMLTISKLKLVRKKTPTKISKASLMFNSITLNEFAFHLSSPNLTYLIPIELIMSSLSKIDITILPPYHHTFLST